MYKALTWYKELFFHQINLNRLNICDVPCTLCTLENVISTRIRTEVILHVLQHHHQVRIFKMGGRLSIDDYPAGLTERHFPSVTLLATVLCISLWERSLTSYECWYCHVQLCIHSCFEKQHCLTDTEEDVALQNLHVVYIMLYM